MSGPAFDALKIHRKKLSLNVDGSLIEDVRQEAEKRGLSLSRFIENLLCDEIDKLKTASAARAWRLNKAGLVGIVAAGLCLLSDAAHAIDLIPVTNSDAFNGFFTIIFLCGIPVFVAAGVVKVISRS